MQLQHSQSFHCCRAVQHGKLIIIRPVIMTRPIHNTPIRPLRNTLRQSTRRDRPTTAMLLNRTEMIKILTGMVAAHTDGPRKTWSALVPKADPERPSVLDRYVPARDIGPPPLPMRASSVALSTSCQPDVPMS